MTTIAVRGLTVAADTLFTCNNIRDHFGQKAWRIGDVIAAASGPAARIHAFRQWVAGGLEGPSPYQGTTDGGNGLIVARDQPLMLFGSSGVTPIHAEFYAAGSGEDFAIGAMEMGASAELAVRIAMKRDTGTGGDITVLSLAEGEDRTLRGATTATLERLHDAIATARTGT